MTYDPLPSNINQRAMFFRELEARYTALAEQAEGLLETIGRLSASESTRKIDDADLIGQGVRKPSRLEYLEASFLLQVPAELSGKSPTEAQRNAWVTKNMQDSDEYAVFAGDHREALLDLTDDQEALEAARGRLRLVYAHMGHLDAWIAFFAAPRPVPPAPAQPPEIPAAEPAARAPAEEPPVVPATRSRRPRATVEPPVVEEEVNTQPEYDLPF